jgi:hypothetical protein
MLGGLRYNLEDLLELILERGMIPFTEFKDSSFYQYVLEEGEIKNAAKALLMLVKNRSPKLNVTRQIKRIQDAAVLQQLCVEEINMPNVVALKKRHDEILESKSH